MCPILLKKLLSFDITLQRLKFPTNVSVLTGYAVNSLYLFKFTLA